MNIQTIQAMGTYFQFVGISAQMAEVMENWLIMVEAGLSRFLPESELNKLNQSAGIPVVCSETLWEAIKIADYYYRETGGIFHPYLGRILSRLGYDRSFEKVSSDQSVALPTEVLSLDQPIFLNTDKKEAILHPLASVDLGGIVKGWCAQKLSTWAKQNGIACGAIDAGGDMVIWGNEDEQGWEVYLENPWDPDVDMIFLRLIKEAGIATSSLVKRQWGEGLHHIIDPRTQASSSSDLIQVTVISADPVLSEVYTKVFLILGSKEGIHYVREKMSSLAYILVKTDGAIIISSNMNDYASEWRQAKKETDQHSC